jgi:hypothetical protein
LIRVAVRFIDAGGPQESKRVLGREVVELDDAQRRRVRRPPVLGGHLPAAEHHAHVPGQLRHERPAQPRIEGVQELVAVDEQHHLLAAGAERRDRGLQRRRLVLGVLSGDGGEERALRRVDHVAVELERGGPAGAGSDGERAQERRLSDAGQPVDVRDDGSAVVEQLAEQRVLAITADERRGLTIDEGAERP